MSRQRSNLSRFFPTPILNHSIGPSHIVRNLGVAFDGEFIFRKLISLTCCCSFYHIHDLSRIRRYISLSVTKTIASRLHYWNSLLYIIPSKDILKLRCIQNRLASVVTRSLRFLSLSDPWNFFIGSLFNIALFSTPVYQSLSSEDPSYIFSSFLYQAIPVNSAHLVFNCCLFPGLKLMLGLVRFQVLFPLWNSLPEHVTSSNSIVSFRYYLKAHLFGLAYLIIC